MAKKSSNQNQQTWSREALSLVGIVLLGCLAAYFVPSLPSSSASIFSRVSNLGFHQFAMLVLTAAITVIYLAFYRARAQFSNRWLVAAVTYNCLVLFIKFTLSINLFIGQSSKSFAQILSSALLVSLLYIGGFLVLYLLFDGKILNKKQHKLLVATNEGKMMLAVAMVLVVTVTRLVIYNLPLLSGSTAANYIGGVFKANTILLNLLLFVIIYATVQAFGQVRRKVDLKYFFVSGITLILAFHLWWATFMFRSY
jgi:hypothetical protein